MAFFFSFSKNSDKRTLTIFFFVWILHFLNNYTHAKSFLWRLRIWICTFCQGFFPYVTGCWKTALLIYILVFLTLKEHMRLLWLLLNNTEACSGFRHLLGLFLFCSLLGEKHRKIKLITGSVLNNEKHSVTLINLKCLITLGLNSLSKIFLPLLCLYLFTITLFWEEDEGKKG